MVLRSELFFTPTARTSSLSDLGGGSTEINRQGRKTQTIVAREAGSEAHRESEAGAALYVRIYTSYLGPGTYGYTFR